MAKSILPLPQGTVVVCCEFPFNHGKVERTVHLGFKTPERKVNPEAIRTVVERVVKVKSAKYHAIEFPAGELQCTKEKAGAAFATAVLMYRDGAKNVRIIDQGSNLTLKKITKADSDKLHRIDGTTPAEKAA